MEITEEAQSVVDGDDHGIQLLRQPLSVIERQGGSTDNAAAAMDEHDDGARSALLRRRRPDVQIQAVFTAIRAIEGLRIVTRKVVPDLSAGGGERCGGPNAFPSQWPLRRRPAQIADRRAGIGNTEIATHAVALGPGNCAFLNRQRRGLRRRCPHCDECQCRTGAATPPGPEPVSPIHIRTYLLLIFLH